MRRIGQGCALFAPQFSVRATRDDHRPSDPAILRAIRAASRRPAATLAVALAFVVGALFYGGAFCHDHRHGRVDQRENAMASGRRGDRGGLPAIEGSILVVVDGQTPELAEDGAIRLSDALGKLGPKGR
jgi:hypothetical protein